MKIARHDDYAPRRPQDDKVSNKPGLRRLIHAEHSQDGKEFGIIAGAFLLLLWVGDWIVDPAHGMRTLPFRLACAMVLFGLGIKRAHFNNLYLDAAITYGGLFACELLVLGLAHELSGGFVAGLGGVICLLVSTLVLCVSLPFHINVMGCALLIVSSTFLAQLVFAADALVYAALLWQVGVMTLLVHYKKRRILVRRSRDVQDPDKTAGDPVVDSPMVESNAVEEWERLYFQLANREGRAASRHTLLIIRIPEKAFTTDKKYRCLGVGSISAQAIGEQIQASLRACDIVRPLNGLDYMCLLSSTEEVAATIVAERIRARLGAMELGCPGIAYKALDGNSLCIEIYRVESFDEFKRLVNRFVKPHSLAAPVSAPLCRFAQ